MRLQNKNGTLLRTVFVLEATPGFEPGDKGFADLCLTTWLCRLMNQPSLSLCAPNNKFDLYIICDKIAYLLKSGTTMRTRSGADYGARTRHLRLGKATLYQMS